MSLLDDICLDGGSLVVELASDRTYLHILSAHEVSLC